MTKIGIDNLVVARVLSEDDDFMTVEIIKNEERKLTLDPETPDQFYTMLFIKQDDDPDAEVEDGVSSVVVYKPWD